MRKFYILFLLFLCCSSPLLHAQVLISPTGDGGFETGATFAANGWTAVNDANNKWYVGTAASTAGTRGAYIDRNNPAGTTNTYNNGVTTVAYIYKDVIIPAGATNITLAFKWRAVGEVSYDYLRVFLLPTTTTPVAGTLLTAGAIGAAEYNASSATAFSTASITIANSAAGTSKRLAFCWNNDFIAGNNPPAALDEISLTFTAPPPPVITSFTPSSGCANAQQITITGTGFGSATDVTIGGTSVSTIVSNTATQLVVIPAAGTTGVIAVTTAGGTGTSATTFTVLPAPSVALIGGGASQVCLGVPSTAFTNSTGGGAWTVSSGTGTATITAGGVLTGTVSGSVTVVYTVTSGGCTGTAVKSVLINALPVAPVITPSSATICSGAIQQLSASSAVNTTIFSETFESGLGSFTLSTEPSHDAGNATQWKSRTSPYNTPAADAWGVTINSGSKFVLANSDAGGSTKITNANLTSPPINTTGYTSLTLTFRHFYDWFFDGNENANVEVSTNGTTWTAVQSYNSDQGAANSFATATIDLSSYVNNANLRIRFRYYATWDWGWAVDDVVLNAVGTNTISWSPTGGLFTNAAATTPYSGGPATTVYAKPTATTIYSATAQNAATLCTKSTAVTVTVSGNNWLGANSNWFNAANWCGGVPLATTDVIIPNGVSFYPVITSGTALARNLSIANNASVTVNGSGIFSLYGAVTNAGTLDLSAGTLDLAGAGVSIGGSQITGAVVKNMTVSNSSASSILSGSTNMLKVTGSLSFLSSNNTFTTNDNLTFISGPAATASITDITHNGAALLSGNSLIGNASVERYIPALRKWRFLAVNTQAGTGSNNSVQSNWMEGQTAGANAGAAGYGLWVTDAAPATGFDAASFTPTIKWWNGSVYTGITNPSSYDIRTKPAYMTFVRGDRSATGTNTVTTQTVLRQFGSLTQGTTAATNVAMGTVYTTLGNPYASAIDLTKLTYSTTNIINVAVWDPNLGGNLDLGAFQYLTSPGPGQDFLIIPGGGSYGAGSFGTVMNIIESGQGYFMQGTGAARNVNFVEIAKTPKAHDVFFAPGSEQRIGAVLSIKEANGGLTLMDGVLVRMQADNNNAADYDDVLKMANTSENVSIKRNNSLLAIEYRNPVDENDTVQFNMSGMRYKNYQWKLSLLNMDQPGRVGYLVDRLSGAETLLNLNGDNLYDFSVTTVAGSYAPDRFLIVFKPAAVLAVRKLTITANKQADGSNLVKWQAENEFSIAQYELERSADATAFTSLNASTLPTNNIGGNAVYTQTDNRPLSGNNYYRVKAVGTNGQLQYSAVVKLGGSDREKIFSVNPNPVTGRVIQLYTNNLESGEYDIRLIGANGQVLFTGSIVLTEGENRRNIGLDKSLKKGVYTLQAKGKSHSYQVRLSLLD